MKSTHDAGLAKPTRGNEMPSGTGTRALRRQQAEAAAEDRQMRGVEGRRAGPLPPAGTPNDLCVRDTDEPMTDEQAEHLRILCGEAGEAFDASLTRDAAARQIHRLQHRAGYKP